MHLLELPGEIRNNIYSLLFTPSACREVNKSKETDYHYDAVLPLLRVNKQIRSEALPIFYSLNQFVLVDTPWADAETHVHLEGRVPVVVPGTRSEGFSSWTMYVHIYAPEVGHSRTQSKFVLHADDLPAFCRTWLYSDLSTPGLNAHLALEVKLRDPCANEWEEPRLKKEIQKRMLLPFGEVKGLHSVEYSGGLRPLKSVQDDLKRLMEEPSDSPEVCLKRATALKDEGNKALKEKRYEDAVEQYRLAWLAIHIVVDGRKRQVHADQWFYRDHQEQPYMSLRVKLVANTVQLYLLMEKFEDACFWGMRTINTFRAAIGLAEDEAADRPEDELIMNFMSTDAGKIYFRTAMAWKAMGERSEARKLLKVSALYLPTDRRVREELAASAPRI